MYITLHKKKQYFFGQSTADHCNTYRKLSWGWCNHLISKTQIVLILVFNTPRHHELDWKTQIWQCSKELNKIIYKPAVSLINQDKGLVWLMYPLVYTLYRLCQSLNIQESTRRPTFNNLSSSNANTNLLSILCDTFSRSIRVKY